MDLIVTPANLTELTRFLLIRHAVTDHIGERISGRMPGIHINQRGFKSLAGLEQEVHRIGFQEVFSSALERCRETAEAIAGGKAVNVRDEFLELNFGEWTGLSFDELHRMANWQRYNRQRSAISAPGGESAFDVQHRAVRGLLSIRQEYGGGNFVVVTHADVIRALLCFVLGTSLDFLLRFQIDPASLTEIEIGEHGMRALRINWRSSTGEC